MKKAVLSLALLLVAIPLFAQNDLTKVGYINIEQLIKDLKKEELFTKLGGNPADAQIRIDRDARSIKQKINLLEEQIEDIRGPIYAPKPNSDISAEDKKKLDLLLERKRLYERELRLTYKEGDYSKRTEKSGDESMTMELKRHIAKAILVVSRRDGYSMVFDRMRAGILYVDLSIDITDEVFDLLKNTGDAISDNE